MAITKEHYPTYKDLKNEDLKNFVLKLFNSIYAVSAMKHQTAGADIAHTVEHLCRRIEMKQRLIDANSLMESLLDCPDDEEVGLKNAKEAGIKENDDTVIIDFWRRCKQSFANFVNAEPTVDPVKHGHWMLRTDGADENFSIMYKCSVCRGTSPKPVLYEYCPMCGAKMDEVI